MQVCDENVNVIHNISSRCLSWLWWSWIIVKGATSTSGPQSVRSKTFRLFWFVGIMMSLSNKRMSFLKNPSVSTTDRFFPLAPGNSTDSRHDTFNQLTDENRHFISLLFHAYSYSRTFLASRWHCMLLFLNTEINCYESSAVTIPPKTSVFVV